MIEMLKDWFWDLVTWLRFGRQVGTTALVHPDDLEFVNGVRTDFIREGGEPFRIDVTDHDLTGWDGDGRNVVHHRRPESGGVLFIIEHQPGSVVREMTFSR
jgi:hypothetical protein